MLNWNCEDLMRERLVLNTCGSRQFHTPTECSSCSRVLVISHFWLKTTSFSRLHSIPLTPTRLQKVISSARPQARAHAGSCATPFRRSHGVAGCERSPSDTRSISSLLRGPDQFCGGNCIGYCNVASNGRMSCLPGWNCLPNNLTRDTFIMKNRVMRCTKTRSGQTLLPRRMFKMYETSTIFAGAFAMTIMSFRHSMASVCLVKIKV